MRFTLPKLFLVISLAALACARGLSILNAAPPLPDQTGNPTD
jgi:hypothetical protein